jgi:hypothetical protein
LSPPAFLEQFGTETQCEAALERARWPEGFRGPRRGQAAHHVLRSGGRKTFRCQTCRVQTSPIAGTLFQSTHLALTLWFLAIDLISQAKTGRSALALKRQLGVSHPTAWPIQHQIMQAMTGRDAQYTPCGAVLVDDAYLGGERVGGKAGRGSENKVPFVAAVSPNAAGHPLHTKMTPVPGFTRTALTGWAKAALAPGSQVISDGLACFTGVMAAGCDHQAILIGPRKPNEVPEFGWVNTILGHLKTGFSGAYHAFKFAKYGSRYLAAFAYRFNRRFHLDTLPTRLLVAAATIGPRPARWLRRAEESC